MQFNVAQQLKSPIGSSRSYMIEEVINLTDEGSYPLCGEVKLLRTNRGIMVKGNLETTAEVVCSRCLSAFHHPLRLKVEEEYFPILDVSSGMVLSEETGPFIIDEKHILDLSEAVRQYILLAIPMKPLCRADCAGLCSYCGRNLNQDPCGCTPVGAKGTGKEKR